MFGKSKKEFLKQLLQLPNGIPSHDNLERVFKRIDSKLAEIKSIIRIEATREVNEKITSETVITSSVYNKR